MTNKDEPATHEKPPGQQRITRREMLRLSGALALGALLPACTPPPTEESAATFTPPIPTPTLPIPTPTTRRPAMPTKDTVVWLGRLHEFTEEQQARFVAENPGIEIVFIPDDRSWNWAMGRPPDVMRIHAPAIPRYLARDMLLDLTPYFEASDVLDLDDLAPANDYYRAHGPLEVGAGPIYGMCKDWSPDLTLFANRRAFEEAGVDLPDDREPLTYREVFALAARLATRGKDGESSGRWGFGYEAAWIDRIWMNALAELGQSLYNDGCSRILLTECEEIAALAGHLPPGVTGPFECAAARLARAYYALAAGNVAANPLDPSPTWNGQDFVDGSLALVQYGCWFAAALEQYYGFPVEEALMLPAPTSFGVRRSPTITAPGHVISASTEVPDAAWKAFEWYHGGEPARERARSGWGVPALKSLYDLMPRETPFQQQVQRVLARELALETGPLQFNPYLDENTVAWIWQDHLERALRGEITFEGLLERVEEEVNERIQEGMDRLE